MKNLKLTILAFIVTLGALSAQNVYIPDSIFKEYLLGEAEINTNGDSEIDSNEASAFTGRITLFSDEVYDLTGIQCFPALTKLWCRNTFLDTLDISKNPALTELFCKGNLFRTLDLSNNLELETLSCNLSSLDVSKNTKLKSLSCSFVQLDSLDVSQNLELEILSFSNTQVAYLDVSNNTALTHLDCRDNDITSLDVSNNPLLEYLYCQQNQITTLNVIQNPNLRHLVCDDNRLTRLDMRNGANVFIEQFKATDNLLLCISVDSEAWANATWPDNKDVGTVYGANCYLGVESLEKDNASITSHGNTISITGEGSVTIYNLLGAMVHQQKLSPGVNQIPLRSGIYLVRSGSTTRKIQLRLD